MKMQSREDLDDGGSSTAKASEDSSGRAASGPPFLCSLGTAVVEPLPEASFQPKAPPDLG